MRQRHPFLCVLVQDRPLCWAVGLESGVGGYIPATTCTVKSLRQPLPTTLTYHFPLPTMVPLSSAKPSSFKVPVSSSYRHFFLLCKPNMRSKRDGPVAENRIMLQKTVVQFPTPTWQLTTVCNSSSRWSDTFFWPLLALYEHGAQTYIHATHPCTRNKNKKKPFYLKKAHYETHQLVVLSRHKLVSPATFPPPHCILDLMRVWAPWRSHTSHCSTTHPRSLLLYVKHAYDRWFHVPTWAGY